MKYIASLIISLFLFSGLIAKPLHCNEVASLYDHLAEVNKEWLNIDNDNFLCEPANFKNDTERIQMHLRLVEKYLRENQRMGLNGSQLKNRSAALDILNDYWNAGNFPQNTFHPSRQPYFVDSYGTACAVGYLALETGASGLVNRIAKEMNFSYIAELKNHYPELLDWANEFGFTIEELAWIQPAYSPRPQTWNTIGNGGGVEGEVQVMKAFGDEMLYMAGEFSEVDGVQANSIIAWDGTTWHPLGNGVNGIVYDMAIDETGRLFIVGEFTLNDDPSVVNVASWYDETWSGFDTGELTQKIFAVHVFENRLYIGGSFEIEYPSQTIKLLAFLEIGEDKFQNQNGDFSVNATVYDIADDGEQLYVAGNFLFTASNSSNQEINHLSTKYLATWDFDENIQNYNWLQAFDHEVNVPIYRIFHTNERLYIAGFIPDEWNYNIGILEESSWIYTWVGSFENSGTSFNFIKGFTTHNDLDIVFGNVNYGGFGVMSQGIIALNDSSWPGYGAAFNAPVNAAISFQDQLYFAGNFTSVQGQEFPGLVASPFDGITNTEFVNDEKGIDVYNSGNQLFIKSEPFRDVVTLNIYNLNGQLLHSEKLQPGIGETTISTQNWAAGMYIYQLTGSGVWQSGKLAVF